MVYRGIEQFSERRLMAVYQGDKWARLECIEIKNEDRLADDGSGGRWEFISSYVFRCECGTEFEVEQHGFRKRDYKDCGCGKSLDYTKAVMNFTVENYIRKGLTKYATENKVSLSYVAGLALKKGIEVLTNENK